MTSAKKGATFMKKSWKANAKISLLLLLLTAVVLLTTGLLNNQGTNSLKSGPYRSSGELNHFMDWKNTSVAEAELEPYYVDALAGWIEQGIADGAQSIEIDGAASSASSNEQQIRRGSYGDQDNVLVWESDLSEWVEYEIEVEEAGLYELHAVVFPLRGNSYTRPIEWDVTIDGERPFREASTITLYRTWRDKDGIVVNDDGDQVRPVAYDIS